MKKNSFYEKQLDEIVRFYQALKENQKKEITLKEAIIFWFTEGHAEIFREQFLKSQQAALQH